MPLLRHVLFARCTFRIMQIATHRHNFKSGHLGRATQITLANQRRDIVHHRTFSAETDSHRRHPGQLLKRVLQRARVIVISQTTDGQLGARSGNAIAHMLDSSDNFRVRERCRVIFHRGALAGQIDGSRFHAGQLIQIALNGHRAIRTGHPGDR